jgi:hypothetical protein
VDCNRLAVDIDNEQAVVHAFVRDKYRLKFPELESLVSCGPHHTRSLWGHASWLKKARLHGVQLYKSLAIFLASFVRGAWDPGRTLLQMSWQV